MCEKNWRVVRPLLIIAVFAVWGLLGNHLMLYVTPAWFGPPWSHLCHQSRDFIAMLYTITHSSKLGSVVCAASLTWAMVRIMSLSITSSMLRIVSLGPRLYPTLQHALQYHYCSSIEQRASVCDAVKLLSCLVKCSTFRGVDGLSYYMTHCPIVLHHLLCV